MVLWLCFRIMRMLFSTLLCHNVPVDSLPYALSSTQRVTSAAQRINITPSVCPVCISYGRRTKRRPLKPARAKKPATQMPWRLSCCNEMLLELLKDELGDRDLESVNDIMVCNLCYLKSRTLANKARQEEVEEIGGPFYRFPFKVEHTVGPHVHLTGVHKCAKPRFRDAGLVGPAVFVGNQSASAAGDDCVARDLLPELHDSAQDSLALSVYNLDRNVPMMTVGDVENLIAFVVANGNRCSECRADFSAHLVGQATEQGRLTTTRRILLTCAQCGFTLKNRYYRSNFTSGGGYAAHVAAFRLALGATSVTSQRHGASSVSDTLPSREACQRVAGIVTQSVQELQDVVSNELVSQLKGLLCAHGLDQPWEQKSPDEVAAIAAASPFFPSFDGFYNSLAGRNAQWAGATLFVTSRVSGVSVQIASIAKSTVTAWTSRLPESDVLLCNAKGAEFLLAVLFRKRLFEAGIKSVPVMVCDADASIQHAFEGFAFCISIDRNHFMKAMLRSANSIDTSMKAAAHSSLEGVSRADVIEEFRTAIDMGPQRIAKNPKISEQPKTDDLPSLCVPEQLRAKYELLWHARCDDASHAIPLVEALQFVDSAGKFIDHDQDFVLKRLAKLQLQQKVDSGDQQMAVPTSDSSTSTASTAVSLQHNHDTASSGSLDAAASASDGAAALREGGAKRERQDTTKCTIRDVLCSLIQRNTLQCAAVCIAKNNPFLIRQLCQIWLNHYQGIHEECCVLFPGGCNPTMAALPKDGAAIRYLTAIVDTHIGTKNSVRLQSVAVALALHSNACESAGSSVRHYAQKNVSFRSRWKDAVYKHFLDKTCGDLYWRQFLCSQHGVTLTAAHTKFLRAREASRAAKALASLSGATSRRNAAAKRRSRSIRAKTKKGGAFSTYKSQGQPSSDLYARALELLSKSMSAATAEGPAFPLPVCILAL